MKNDYTTVVIRRTKNCLSVLNLIFYTSILDIESQVKLYVV